MCPRQLIVAFATDGHVKDTTGTAVSEGCFAPFVNPLTSLQKQMPLTLRKLSRFGG